MNKNLTLLCSILFSSVITMIYYFSISSFNGVLLDEVSERFEEKTRVELQNLAHLVRGDLLQNNIRAARNRISQGIDSDVIDFGIHKAGEGSGQKPRLIKEDFFSVEIPIAFSSTSDEIWGTIRFLVSNSESLQLKASLNKMLSLTSFLVWVLIMLVILIIYGTLDVFSEKLQRAFLQSFSKEGLKSFDGSFFFQLWKPFLNRMGKQGRMHQKNQSEIAKLKEQEILYSVYRKISHDMKSPVGAIETIAQQSDQLPTKHRDLLKNAVQRIKELSEDYLYEYKKQSVDSFSVSEALELLNGVLPLFHEKNIDLSQEISESEKALVKYNQIGLKNIIINTLQNAFEAGAKRVHIRFTKNHSSVILEFIDNGHGISHDNIEKIERGQFTSKSMGNGLGVSTSKNLLVSWGGDLVISPLSQGTKIELVLPIS